MAGPSSTGSRTLLSNLPNSTLTQADEEFDHEMSNEHVQVTRNVNPNQAGAVISKIEDIFESIADCLLEEGKELVIELKSRSKSKDRVEDGGVEEVRRTTRKIRFPSRNQKEAWKFGMSQSA